MNIAINARFLLKDKLEGIGRFTYEITKRMVLQHPKVNFYFFFDRKYDPSFIFADNVKPVILFPPARHPFLYIIWFEYSVKKALLEYDIDVFLSTDGFLTLSTNVPAVLVVHDLAAIHYPQHIKRFQRWYYKKFTPLFVEKAEKIIAVSRATKKDIMETYCVLESKIDVIYNACSFEAPIKEQREPSQKYKYTDGKPYILYVGAIHPRKNIHNLILAFNELKSKIEEPLSLLIVGRKAWNTVETENNYQNSPYKKDIFFNAHISHKELQNIYRHASLFAYISKFEGFGIPILEAMHYGIPIVTSSVSSMPEVVGDAGLLVNPENPKDIAEKMSQILNSSELRGGLKANSLIQKDKFNWLSSANKMFDVLVEVANK